MLQPAYLVEYHSRTRPRTPRSLAGRSRRRARWQAKAATASASVSGARTTTSANLSVAHPTYEAKSHAPQAMLQGRFSRFLVAALVLLALGASLYTLQRHETGKDFLLTDCNGCSEAAQQGRQSSRDLSYSRSQPEATVEAPATDWQPDEAERERCDPWNGSCTVHTQGRRRIADAGGTGRPSRLDASALTVSRRRRRGPQANVHSGERFPIMHGMLRLL